MKRIAEAELTQYRRGLLMEIVEAYMPLHGPHLVEFQSLLTTETYKMIRELAKTTRELGIEEGLREMLWRLIKKRFGLTSDSVRKQLNALSDEQLSAIEDKLFSAQTLSDLGLGEAVNGAHAASV